MDAAGTAADTIRDPFGARLRALIASSPWLTISVLLHVMAIATLTVIYVAGGNESEPQYGVEPLLKIERIEAEESTRPARRAVAHDEAPQTGVGAPMMRRRKAGRRSA